MADSRLKVYPERMERTQQQQLVEWLDDLRDRLPESDQDAVSWFLTWLAVDEGAAMDVANLWFRLGMSAMIEVRTTGGN